MIYLISIIVPLLSDITSAKKAWLHKRDGISLMAQYTCSSNLLIIDSEFWSYKMGCLWWKWPYKMGIIKLDKNELFLWFILPVHLLFLQQERQQIIKNMILKVILWFSTCNIFKLKSITLIAVLHDHLTFYKLFVYVDY